MFLSRIAICACSFDVRWFARGSFALAMRCLIVALCYVMCCCVVCACCFVVVLCYALDDC